jgi:hypothetical protein
MGDGEPVLGDPVPPPIFPSAGLGWDPRQKFLGKFPELACGNRAGVTLD